MNFNLGPLGLGAGDGIACDEALATAVEGPGMPIAGLTPPPPPPPNPAPVLAIFVGGGWSGMW